MSKTIPFRLLICCALALSGAFAVAPQAAYAKSYGGGGSSCTTNPNGGSTSTNDDNYQTILDFTQASTLNVLVTNIAASLSTRAQPHIGSNPAPYAGVDPSLIPSTFTNWPTGSSSDMYVRVAIDQCDLTNTGLRTATQNTCNQSNAAQCPSGSTVPQTFVHRLGYYDTSVSPNVVKPLTITTTLKETLNSLFKLNGQAFDMDRLRYVANRLWNHWRLEYKGTDTTASWSGFGYQPTGTMSFENFVHNVVTGKTMYGIVRVVVPVDSSGNVYYNPKEPVAGHEFDSAAYAYSKADALKYSGSKGLYTFEELDTADGRSGSASNASSQNSGNIKVDGMLLFDFVDVNTYDPAHFFDSYQDYVDRYTSVANHDAASTTGRDNVIMGATVSRNSIALWDWDSLNINAVDDLTTQVQYSAGVTPTAGPDNRADTLDIIRRKYMMAGSTNSKQFDPKEVSDAYVWEYWMRKAIVSSPTTRTSILGKLASQYDIPTQTFTNTGGLRNDFNTTEWNNMLEKDRFHAYFPNGYERGWILAFAKLNLAALDQTTATKAVGSWWAQLPSDATSNDGKDASNTKLGGDHNHPGHTPSGPYPNFEVPSDTLSVVAVTGGSAVTMPNFFSGGWEDLPALAFAGGLLDVHGFMNVSGMMYTPDSCELETHPASGQPSTPTGTGAFEYVNGAILIGDGFWLMDDGTGDHSLIAISYNYNSFDHLRGSSVNLTITGATNISEIKG